MAHSYVAWSKRIWALPTGESSYMRFLLHARRAPSGLRPVPIESEEHRRQATDFLESMQVHPPEAGSLIEFDGQTLPADGMFFFSFWP